MLNEEKSPSEFNEAVYQIMRLHQIWTDARNSRESGNLQKLRWNLDSAEIELSEDIRRLKERGEDYFQDLKDINKELGEKDYINPKARQEIYKLLLDKEKFLRKIQDLAGKGAKYKDVGEDEIE